MGDGGAAVLALDPHHRLVGDQPSAGALKGMGQGHAQGAVVHHRFLGRPQGARLGPGHQRRQGADLGGVQHGKPRLGCLARQPRQFRFIPGQDHRPLAGKAHRPVADSLKLLRKFRP